MLKGLEMLELEILYKQGKSLKEIARLTGYSINTVRKYARDHEAGGYRSRAKQPQKLDGYRDYLKERVKQAHPNWLPATVLYREIKTQGYLGEISLLRAYLRLLKPEVKEAEVKRFETEPGKQMQIDWAHFRYLEEVIYAFVAVLGYSRFLYVEFVKSQALESWLSCHERLFNHLGGIPESILYDNAKTVIIQRNAYGKGLHRLQPTFLDFAKHYGFVPKVCQPYRPQTKGKVERMIHYLRNSFYLPWQTLHQAQNQLFDLTVLNQAVSVWLDEVANQRVHETVDAVPAQLFQEEQKTLFALPKRYQGALPKEHPQERLARREQMIELCSPLLNLQHPLSVYDTLLTQGGC